MSIFHFLRESLLFDMKNVFPFIKKFGSSSGVFQGLMKKWTKGSRILKIVLVMDESCSQDYHWNPRDILDVEYTSLEYAVLILNRPLSNKSYILDLWKKAAIRVAVDGGTNHWYDAFAQNDASVTWLLPDMITGDFDSVKPEILAHYKEKGVDVIETPDQNETDFTKALLQIAAYVKQKNMKIDAAIAVVDSSGRLDHIAANINTLYKADKILIEIPVFLLGRNSLCWKLCPGYHEISVPTPLVYSKRWCSLIPFGSPSTVTTTGLKWNLDNRIMEFGKMVSTSNTYDGKTLVTVQTSGHLVWSMAVIVPERGEDEDD